MTENEAKEWIMYLGNQNLPYDRSPKSRKLACDIAIQALSEIQQYRAIGNVEEVKYLVDSYNGIMHDFGDGMMALEQYRTIGTIEEFKAYKNGDCMNDCEHYDNCSDYMYSKGYNKAIDEFAEKLKKLYQAYDIDLCLQDNDHLNYTDSRIALESYIDEIAEQLKAGGKNV